MRLFRATLISGWIVLACMVLATMAVPQNVRHYISLAFQVVLPIWFLLTGAYLGARFYVRAIRRSDTEARGFQDRP